MQVTRIGLRQCHLYRIFLHIVAGTRDDNYGITLSPKTV